ncbi:MAG: superoxide dismutase [Alphaproteobacteria bacterium]|nr:superoxide dismutase [Alphaproteobacteria bacterium]
MKNTYNRRRFIKNTATVAVGSVLLNTVAAAQDNALLTVQQLPLPYSFGSLEPTIDTKTMEIHYTKHAAGYTKNLNAAIKQFNIKANNVEDILYNVSKYPDLVRNNVGGHFNHEFFWRCMTPSFAPLPEQLQKKIVDDFGGMENFKMTFEKAAKSVFGSGWAWLINEYSTQKLTIITTANQDNPMMDNQPIKGNPLLGIDVWEHAYYLKYQNVRADYISNWWKIIDWNFVNQNLTKSFTC